MTKEEIRNVDAFALMQAIAMAQGEKMKEEEKELDIPYGTESIKEFIEERKMAKKRRRKKKGTGNDGERALHYRSGTIK